METKIDINDKVKAVAKKNGWAYGDLAKAMGLTRNAMWSRLKDPKLSTLEQIAGIIGVPVAAFFTETGFSSGETACPHCGAEIKVYLG